MNKVQKHKEICEELNKVYEQKNHDYGDSFAQTFDKLGIISAVTRISDKYNRLVSLSTKSEEERKVKDESITDTLLDMANYCIMTVIELHKNDNDKNIDYNDCEHNWEYVATDVSIYPSVETKRCTKCGATKQIKLIAL